MCMTDYNIKKINMLKGERESNGITYCDNKNLSLLKSNYFKVARNAIKSLRSSTFLMPKKGFFVPGINFLGHSR